MAKLSIYLGEDRIQVLLGEWKNKIHIKRCEEYILPEGTLINDIVFNEEAFCSVLRAICKSYVTHRSKVRLMLGSNQIVTKTIQAPKLPHPAMVELVKKELETLIGSQQQMLYDYSVIGDKLILGAGLEKEKLDKLLHLFGSEKLKIKSVDIALNGMIRLSQYLTDLKECTYLLCLVDGRNLMASLFKRGRYIYAGRIRLLSERGSKEVIHEIGKHLQSFVQFYYLEKHKDLIENIYLGGFKADEEAQIGSYIEDKVKIPIGSLSPAGDLRVEQGQQLILEDYFFTVGNLYGR